MKITIEGTKEELSLAVPRLSKLIQVQSAELPHPDPITGQHRYIVEGDLIQDKDLLMDELYDFLMAADEDVDVERFETLLAALDRLDPLPEIQASPNFFDRLRRQIREM